MHSLGLWITIKNLHRPPIKRESSEIRLLRTSHPELSPPEDKRGLCCDFPAGSYRTEIDRERRHSRNPISLHQVLGLPSRTPRGVQQREIRVRRSWAPIHCGDRDLDLAVDQKPHGESRRMPAACRQPSEDRIPRRVLVEMEWLGIVCNGLGAVAEEVNRDGWALLTEVELNIQRRLMIQGTYRSRGRCESRVRCLARDPTVIGTDDSAAAKVREPAEDARRRHPSPSHLLRISLVGRNEGR